MLLIVEDERIVAKDIQATLLKQGYDVVGIVSSGEQALEQMVAVRPDIVLMDVMLDGELDGIETANIINIQFDVPVVFLTALSNTAIVERAKLSIRTDIYSSHFRNVKFRL